MAYYSKPWNITPNPGILLQPLEYYSKPWYITPNPGILLQPL